MVDGSSHLVVARSDDGHHFELDSEPVLANAENKRFYDPRATRIDDDYYVTFGIDYPGGEITTGLARTCDFHDFEYMGEISEPDTRNTVLFPEKIGGYYARLNRPFPLYYHWGWPAGTHPAVKEGRTWPGTLNAWISFSPDLVFWGKSRVLLRTEDVYWARHRLGPGAPPIRTDHGWLEIFHGTELTDDGRKIYRAGVMLLDLDDPSVIIGLAKDPILTPVEPYEREGNVPNVVFVCGAILEHGGEVKIYYGGADSCVCLATVDINRLVSLCLEE